jgi:hypothetical protein
LSAITAISATDAWAVGYKNDNNLNDSRTLIQHWDGARWKRFRVLNPGSTADCKEFNSENAERRVRDFIH